MNNCTIIFMEPPRNAILVKTGIPLDMAQETIDKMIKENEHLGLLTVGNSIEIVFCEE